MTQCIIPGCEANPDPATVINVDPTKPMKEIPMDELNNNTDNIPESFKQFLATGSSVIETCRELMAENQRLRLIQHDYEQVFKDHGIMSADNLRLYLEDYAAIQKVMEKHELNDEADLGAELDKIEKGNGAEPPADYQTLKDFKGEMDAIHEEFDIPHDVDAFRKDLKMGKDIADMIEANTDVDFSVDTWAKDLQDIFDDYRVYKEACDNHSVDPDDLDSKLDELDCFDGVCSDHGLNGSDEVEESLTEWEDMKKYEKGFNELAEFVEKIKEVIGHCGDDIPSTDVEDYD